MRRFIFSNMQGLSEEAVSARLAFLHQLMAEEGVTLAFLCEVMHSSLRLRPIEVTESKRASARSGISEPSSVLATKLAHNSALGDLGLQYLRSYPSTRYDEKHSETKQKGYGVLSRSGLGTDLVTDIFAKASTRAPNHWQAPDGMHVYALHAISNHGAARKELRELVAALQKRHPNEPWMIVGDMNCPPPLLDPKCVVGKTRLAAFPDASDVYICLPEGPTRPSSGNLLDYVISNVPCRVSLLPRNASGLELMLKAGFDHHPILVEYHIDPRWADRPKEDAAERLRARQFALRFLGRPLPGFRRVRVAGDGNCLFRAVGRLAGRGHQELRQAVVQYLIDHWADVVGFVGGPEYLADMTGDGVWGGHVELWALSRLLGRRIVVHRADGGRTTIGDGHPPLRLYYTGAHYDALIASGPSVTEWVNDSVDRAARLAANRVIHVEGRGRGDGGRDSKEPLGGHGKRESDERATELHRAFARWLLIQVPQVRARARDPINIDRMLRFLALRQARRFVQGIIRTPDEQAPRGERRRGGPPPGSPFTFGSASSSSTPFTSLSAFSSPFSGLGSQGLDSKHSGGFGSVFPQASSSSVPHDCRYCGCKAAQFLLSAENPRVCFFCRHDGHF